MIKKENSKKKGRQFNVDYKNIDQKIAWMAFQQHDILFLTGPAGVGKSYLATAFAITEILAKNKKKIILTRPILEAGENLGWLPKGRSRTKYSLT